jgi:hypothetical protein
VNTTDAIQPFQIDIPQAELDSLNRKLDDTRWPSPMPGDGWDTGVPVSWLREITGYWRSSYDWREAERQLNDFPQFTTVLGVLTTEVGDGVAW